MSEARNAIIVVLILLFVLIGTGVAISRFVRTDKTESEGQEEGGVISRIFFTRRFV
jgi:hypothetical protein